MNSVCSTRTANHKIIWALLVSIAMIGPVFHYEPAISRTPTGENSLHFVSIEPTVFMVRQENQLMQLVEIGIENSAGETSASLHVEYDTEPVSLTTITAEKGKNQIEVFVPDIAHPRQVTFLLTAGDNELDRKSLAWQPQRRWKVFFVPITHHDLGYTDTIENVLNQYAGFYDDVLRFCLETDGFPEEAQYRYTAEGSWSMQHFFDNRPEESIAQLEHYVKGGRIEIGALFGNEISALCGHEQLIRLMYPSFRLGAALGGAIRTGSITDIPGLSWGLPKVMAGAGVKYFFAGLPTYFHWGRNDIHTFWDEERVLRHERPDAFRWQGPDGQAVLVYYQGSYGFFGEVTGPDSIEYIRELLPVELMRMEKSGSPFSVARYIHNGVDNHPPDVKISHIVREWNTRWAYPRLIVSTNTMFFEELEKQCSDVRTFRGELPHTDYTVGAISTAKETAINRLTHDGLLTAEKLAAVASVLCDAPYPALKIRNAYNDMNLYDEHTWGKSEPVGELQDWAWNEKSHYAYRAAGQARTIMETGVSQLTNRIKCESSGRYIMVFNPLSYERTDVARLTRFSAEEPVELIDIESGEKIPCQLIPVNDPQAPAPYAAYRSAMGSYNPRELYDLVFIARNVPSVGYKTYRIEGVTKAEAGNNALQVKDNVLENKFFRITAQANSGGISSIYDKELNRELVDPGAPHTVNQFAMRWIRTGRIEGPVDIEIHEGQKGPISASLIIKSAGPGCPQISQEITVYDQLKRIDFANRILKDSTPLQEIYFAFPFKVSNPDFRFEASNSVIKPFRDQFPGSNTNYYTVQHWADVSDGSLGITLSPVESHIMEFGGLWPTYVSQAHHGIDPPGYGSPFIRPEEVTNGYIYAFVMSSNFRTNFQPVQQSDILFRFSMTTHAGDWRQGNCAQFGWAAGTPFIVREFRGKNDGNLAAEKMSFCSVDKSNVLVTAIKEAEDGDGLIIRLIETTGVETLTRLTFPDITAREAYLTNLMEQNHGKADFTEHEILVPVASFGIATIRLSI